MLLNLLILFLLQTYPEALDLYNSGLYQEAIIVLNQDLKKNPDDLDSRTLLASAYFTIKKFDEAVKECEKVLTNDSTDTEAKRILTQARAELDKERTTKLKYYETLVKKHPENPSYRLALARSYVQVGNYRAAEKNYQEYLKRKPDDREALFEYAQVLSWQKENSRAIAIYRKLLQEKPDDIRLRIALGYALLWSGRSAEAKTEFLAVLKVDSTSREANEGLNAIARLGTKAPAYPIDRYYALLKRAPKNNRIRLALIEELLKAKRFEEAMDECQTLLALEPEHPEGITMLNLIDSLRTEFHQERVNSLTEYLKQHPENLTARLNLASSLPYLGRFREASAHLRTYLKKRPADTEARLMLAHSLFNAGDIEEALVEYERILKESPNNLQIRLEYAQCLFWQDSKRAKKELLLILTKNPNHVTARLTLANLYLISGDLKRAEEQFEKVLEIRPGNRAAEQGLKDIEVERQKQIERELWQKLDGARAATGNKDYPAAIALYEQYLKQRPTDYKVKLEYARVLSWANQYSRSVDVYQEILRQFPLDPDLRTEFAQLLFWQGDYPQAAEEYEKVLKLYPKDSVDTKVLLGLADAYREMGDYERATAKYREILKINPYANIAHVGLKSIRRELQSVEPWGSPLINAIYSRVDAPKDFHNYLKSFSAKISLSSNFQIAPGYQHNTFQEFDTNYYCHSYFLSLDYKIDPKLRARFNISYNLYNGPFSQGSSVGAFNWRFPAFSAQVEYKIRPDVQLGAEYERKELIYAAETLPALKESLFGEKIGLNGEYRYNQTWRFNARYLYGIYSDANQSQELLLGTAYYLVPELSVGYEYNNRSYKDTSPFYWAPLNYQTHEFWSNLSKTLFTTLTFNAKFGVIMVPNFPTWEKELETSVYYSPWANLTLGVVLGFSTRERELRRSLLFDMNFYF